jgi:hypothetical protein
MQPVVDEKQRINVHIKELYVKMPKKAGGY